MWFALEIQNAIQVGEQKKRSKETSETKGNKQITAFLRVMGRKCGQTVAPN